MAFSGQLSDAFNMPQTRLKANSAVQVAVLTLTGSQQASLRWCSVHFVALFSGEFVPLKVNRSLGSVYAAVYGGAGAIGVNAPSGQPLLYIPVELPGEVGQANPSYPCLLGPGTYVILAVNNLQFDAAVTVTGAFKIDL